MFIKQDMTAEENKLKAVNKIYLEEKILFKGMNISSSNLVK